MRTRLPMTACPACLRYEKIDRNGNHVDKTKQRYRCPFVEAELALLKEEFELLGVYTTKRGALRATGGDGGIHWIGQAPRNIWLAMRCRAEKKVEG